MALTQTLPVRGFRAPPGAPPAVAEESVHNALRSLGSVCRFGRNETIFSDGADANASYKVVSGAVRLIKLMPDGRRHVAGFALEGDLFGLEWTGVYGLTAESVTEVTAIRYGRTQLERLGEERPEVRRQLTERLRMDLCAAHQHLLSLGCKTARERVAWFLLSLARRGGTGQTCVSVPMGRQDIADYLGLTIETVCRTLSELRASSAIAIPGRHEIVIRSIVRLRMAADTGDNSSETLQQERQTS